MKLWYQSMSRQTEWGAYPCVLRGILDKVRDLDIGRIPQALWGGHLSDGEGRCDVLLSLRQAKRRSDLNRARNPHDCAQPSGDCFASLAMTVEAYAR